MRMHLTIPAAVFATLMTAATATGNRLLFLLAVLCFLTVLLCLAGVLWVSATIQIEASASAENVYRGDDISLQLRVRHRGWIPVAPVLLQLNTLTGSHQREIRLKNMPGRTQTLNMNMHAVHIGVYTGGIRSCTVEDLLGIFEKKITSGSTEFTLTVLPLTFPTEPLGMAPGDPGSDIMARAAEDLNAPSDVRSYQPGDAVKKIHWKLSMRKGELMVRRFDEPVLQDALILMDCSRIPATGNAEKEAGLRDTLLETAASFFSDQIRQEHTVRMPLTGEHPVETDDSMGIAAVFDILAGLSFSATERFDRVLMMESRRLGKTGCIAVITAGLNGSIVDMMIRMHRMGPNMRLYLVTFTPDEPAIMPLIRKLRHSGIDVAYVEPDTTQ